MMIRSDALSEKTEPRKEAGKKPVAHERPRDRRLRATSVLNLALEPARGSQAAILAPKLTRPIFKTTLIRVVRRLRLCCPDLIEQPAYAAFEPGRYS